MLDALPLVRGRTSYLSLVICHLSFIKSRAAGGIVCWIVGGVSSVCGFVFTVCLHGFYMGFSVITVGLGVWIVYARCRVSGERAHSCQVFVGIGVRWDFGGRGRALVSRIGA